MGTRSTTRFVMDGEEILRIYKQLDGYIKGGWGEELKEFTKSGKFVNGYSSFEAKQKTIFNGFEDFVLQLICNFKEGTGGIYATTKDDLQEYNYCVEWKTIEERDALNNRITQKAKITISCDEEPDYKESWTFVMG